MIDYISEVITSFMGMDTSRSLKRLMLQSVKWRNEQPLFMGIYR